MHELSIALGIVKIAEQEAVKNKASQILSIELEIGVLAGVELDSLNFVWPSAVKGTILENSKKEIITIDAVAVCVDCDTKFQLHNSYDACPKCASNLKIIEKGKELRVKSLIVE